MINLDNMNIYEKLDIDSMYSKIIHLPEQILLAYNEVKIHEPNNITEIEIKKIDSIIICGMGGSAISGDIAKACFKEFLPIEVVKDYNIPFINERSLVIAISYSGNTEETISCLQQALKTTPFISAITSGGKIRDLIEEKYLWVELAAGMPPRSAIGLLFFSLIRILEKFQIIPAQLIVVNKLVASLSKKAAAICKANQQELNIAKSSAAKIAGKIPMIYSSSPDLAALAYRWKCQINENAKYPAFFHTLPEMNHNEIEGWEHLKLNNIFIPIFLKRLNELDQYNKRLIAFKKILNEKKVEYLEFLAEGESLMEQIFSLIYLGDMISYYLAILEETDPTKINYIDFLKKEISRKG